MDNPGATPPRYLYSVYRVHHYGLMLSKKNTASSAVLLFFVLADRAFLSKIQLRIEKLEESVCGGNDNPPPPHRRHYGSRATMDITVASWDSKMMIK